LRERRLTRENNPHGDRHGNRHDRHDRADHQNNNRGDSRRGSLKCIGQSC
jgi:hypothetical protein